MPSAEHLSNTKVESVIDSVEAMLMAPPEPAAVQLSNTEVVSVIVDPVATLMAPPEPALARQLVKLVAEMLSEAPSLLKMAAPSSAVHALNAHPATASDAIEAGFAAYISIGRSDTWPSEVADSLAAQ